MTDSPGSARNVSRARLVVPSSRPVAERRRSTRAPGTNAFSRRASCHACCVPAASLLSSLVTVATPSSRAGRRARRSARSRSASSPSTSRSTQYMQIFQRYQLGSPAALLRTMAQNSKCFVVVERRPGDAEHSDRSARSPVGRDAAGREHGRRPDESRRLRDDRCGSGQRQQRRRRWASAVGGVLGRKNAVLARSAAA